MAKAEPFNPTVQRGTFRAAGKGSDVLGLGSGAPAAYSKGDAISASSPCLLPDAIVDAIHRCVTDAGRVADSDQYYENVLKEVPAVAYLEMVAIVATLTQIDTLHYAVGWPLTSCPAATSSPSSSLTAPPKLLALGQECYPHVARVPTVPLNNATHPLTMQIYYGKQEQPTKEVSPWKVPNILRMLSGTPGDHETFVRSVGAMYVMDLNPDEDDDGKGKSITRVQMELLATKTSQVNDCAY